MNPKQIRQQLLAALRKADYRPATIPQLQRILNIRKKDRGKFQHEVRQLLGDGTLSHTDANKIVSSSNGAAAPVGRDRRARLQDTPQKQTPEKIPQRPIFKFTKKTPATKTAATCSQDTRQDTRRPRQAAAKTPAPRQTAATSANNLIGKITFRQSGNAIVIPLRAPNAPVTGNPAIDIFSEDTATALPGDTVEIAHTRRKSARNPQNRMGRVIRVIERANDTTVGTLQRTGKTYYVRPDDPRFQQEIAVKLPAQNTSKPTPKNVGASLDDARRQPAAPKNKSASENFSLQPSAFSPSLEPGDKVLVRLDLANWKNRAQILTGQIIERLGKTFEPRAELLGIYRKYNLDADFPEPVRRQAAAIPPEVLPADHANRLDCRQLPTITIDPDDAKDFDDALSIETLPNGNTRIGIHIADVSHYVRPGTPIDTEARRRGNSTYLVGAVVPMLPEKLSNGLCSLVEAQDRLTKTVFITYTKQGTVAQTQIANTLIRSRKRLTYRQAYALLFTDALAKIRALPLPPKHQTGSTGRALSTLTDTELRQLQTWTRQLWTIASKLRRDRFKNGSLDLDMPETKIFVDQNGYADRLEKIENDESHQLIEEFMLAANETVARTTRRRRQPSLYRVHDQPDDDRLDELRDKLATHNIRVGDLSHRPEITKLLALLATHPEGHILRTEVLRSLKKACYRATPDGHYGLNKNDYTHFTSPIRRYSDLVVHRVLNDDITAEKTARDKQPPKKRTYTPADMTQLGEHLSATEINSQEAERESVKIKLAEYFERELDKQPRTQFPAIITDANQRGLFIELTDSLAFGFINTSSLPDDYYMLRADKSGLVGRRTKTLYAVGQPITVEVEKVDRIKRLIDFRPAKTPPSKPAQRKTPATSCRPGKKR